MRKDLTLKINTTDSDSSIYENNLIGVEGENLQGRLILQLDKPIEGVGLLHVKFEDGLTMFITMNHNVDFSEYSILIKSSLLKYSNVQVQLEIRENETDDGIPKFKSAIYNLAISPTIVGTIEEPDEYPDWLDEANAKLKEIDDVLENLDEVIENSQTQSDWNQNDTSKSDYIKNRPFYENNVRTENVITEAVEKVPEEIDTVMNYYYFTEDEKTIISNFLADKTEVTLKLRMNGNDYIFDCYLNNNGKWAYREQPVFGLDLNLNAFNIMCASTTGITGVQTVELMHISDGEIVTIPEKYMPLNYQGFEKRIKDLEEKLEKYTYLVLEEGKTNGTN